MFTYNSDNLLFNEEVHVYTRGNIQFKSVTQVLKDNNLINTKWFTDQGRDNGTRRHLVTELYDKGTLDIDSVDSADQPYLDAWILAKQQMSIQIIEIESRMYHPVLNYAGTADRLALVGGVPTVLDIKTGAKNPVTALQLCLYSSMITFPQPVKMLVVYLKDNGKYKPDWIGADDKYVAIGAARLTAWRSKNGL